ncbi:MAG: 5-oxoprolinase subunit PxpB [Bacteroidetes bacterium]|nr:5-oxoprolinase subunit PxpB [Bacteroidota bacterium]
MTHPYSIFSLGDAAQTIDLGNTITEASNRKVLAMQEWLLQHPFEGLNDIIPAYCSLTVVYDPVAVRRKYHPGASVAGWVRGWLEKAYAGSGDGSAEIGTVVNIPVCYDPATGMDLTYVAKEKKKSVEEIIHLHSSVSYRVYMIGFLPGFPYLAEVNPALFIPRKARPVPVLPGSVGIAGPQTGVYTLASPGGWYILGRTPLKLFDPASPEVVKLKAGDTVKFFPISLDEFKEREQVGSVVMW